MGGSKRDSGRVVQHKWVIVQNLLLLGYPMIAIRLMDDPLESFQHVSTVISDCSCMPYVNSSRTSVAGPSTDNSAVLRLNLGRFASWLKIRHVLHGAPHSTEIGRSLGIINSSNDAEFRNIHIGLVVSNQAAQPQWLRSVISPGSGKSSNSRLYSVGSLTSLLCTCNEDS